MDLPEDVFESSDERDIIEEYNEEAEAEWRRKHVESVKKQKQSEAADRQRSSVDGINIVRVLDDAQMIEELAEELENLEVDDDDMLAKVLSGEIKVPEGRQRVAHNVREDKESSKSAEAVELLKSPLHQILKSIPEINNNSLIAQNNHEIVELLRTYRSKIKEVLKNVKKDDERNVNLFLDLIELKDDIEDDIRKLNDVEQSSESDQGDSDDATVSADGQPEDTKRRVRFSTSLEDVRMIEPKSSEDSLCTNTIQIHFAHTDARFSWADSEDETIAHPADIYTKFSHCFKSLTLPAARKSILKNKSPEVPTPEIVIEEPMKKIFLSDIPIIGEVMEHKLETNHNAVVHIMSKDDTPKKVSKFKQMRIKT